MSYYHYTMAEVNEMPIRLYMKAFEQAVNTMRGQSGGTFNFMSGQGLDDKYTAEYKLFKEAKAKGL